jgi:hypothetical protein
MESIITSVITFVQSNQLFLMVAAFSIVIGIFVLIFSGERVNSYHDYGVLHYGKTFQTPWLQLKMQEWYNAYGNLYAEHIERQIECGRFYKRY